MCKKKKKTVRERKACATEISESLSIRVGESRATLPLCNNERG